MEAKLWFMDVTLKKENYEINTEIATLKPKLDSVINEYELYKNQN